MGKVNFSFVGKTKQILNLRDCLLKEFDEFSCDVDKYHKFDSVYRGNKKIGSRKVYGFNYHYYGDEYSLFLNYKNIFKIKNKIKSFENAKFDFVLNSSSFVILETLIERVKNTIGFEKNKF